MILFIDTPFNYDETLESDENLKMNSYVQIGKSGIKIKKKNRGKFTSYCGGTVTDECIARGKNSPNPAIRKRATFAANARRWKHANGGLLRYYQEGGVVNDYASTLNPYWQKIARIFNIKNDDEFDDFIYNHPSISNFQNLWEGNIEPDAKKGKNFTFNYYQNEVGSRFPGKTAQTLDQAFGDSWRQKTPLDFTDDDWRKFANQDSINASEFRKKNPYASYYP